MKRYISFYNSYKDRLFSYLVRMTGDGKTAADILQETFTRFLEHYTHTVPNPALL